MSLSSLAKIELQLIMQHCDRKSLLALARCSRSTLAAAQSDFAWRCLSPLRVHSSVPELSQKLSSSLLRHVDVWLWVTEDCPPFPFAPPRTLTVGSIDASEVHRITAVQRIRGLDFACRQVKPEQMRRLLHHPACAQLIDLRSQRPLPFCSLPQHQPLLRSLSVNVDLCKSEELAPIARLQHLTELRVVTYGGILDSLDSLAACGYLSTLALTGSIRDAWPALLSAPPLQSLRSLEMHCAASAGPPSESAWDAAFANQRALESLLIVTCLCVNLLLPLVSRHCRSLRMLSVRWDGVLDPADLDAHVHNDQPTVSALRDCLQQLPSMRLKLNMPSRQAWIRRVTNKPSAAERWDAAHAAFQQLALDSPGRMHIILRDA